MDISAFPPKPQIARLGWGTLVPAHRMRSLPEPRHKARVIVRYDGHPVHAQQLHRALDHSSFDRCKRLKWKEIEGRMIEQGLTEEESDCIFLVADLFY